jgi:hypothetical protein
MDVDPGEENPARNRTPIPVPDGLFPKAEIEREFASRWTGLPGKLQKFVAVKISQFGRSRIFARSMIRMAILAAFGVGTLLVGVFLGPGTWRDR